MLLTLTNTTHSVNSSEVERKWFVVDATDQPLGRIASRIASVLRGKHTPQYTKNADTGDYVLAFSVAVGFQMSAIVAVMSGRRSHPRTGSQARRETATYVRISR